MGTNKIPVLDGSTPQGHQDLSGYQCEDLDVVEMQLHAEHNYFKVRYTVKKRFGL